jgi:hypothetical protein|tara:strand:- start:456 stop:563 length:108 start_codon:yes stop_codon:yes gene_type:complete
MKSARDFCAKKNKEKCEINADLLAIAYAIPYVVYI